MLAPFFRKGWPSRIASLEGHRKEERRPNDSLKLQEVGSRRTRWGGGGGGGGDDLYVTTGS